jgi:SprT-like family protein
MVISKHRSIKKRLEKEIGPLCYQIGIPSLEEPKICWNQEQWRWYTGANKTKSVHRLGCCNFRNNAILIDLNVHKFHKYPLAEYRDTLIHELVHIRFQKLKHGITFKRTIERIKKGQKFTIRDETDKRNFISIPPSSPQ